MSVVEENWDVHIDLNAIEMKCYNDFEVNIRRWDQYALDLLENCFKEKFSLKGDNISQNNDDELKTLTEQNQQLRLDIDNKLGEIAKQKLQYEQYRKDKKLLSQEIKETHEAFLTARKYYKKFLNMYYTIEATNGATQTIFVQFFVESKKDSDNYSVKLLRDTTTGCYQLLSTTPKLQGFEALQKQLQLTNDVPGALCCIRYAFLNLKKNKK